MSKKRYKATIWYQSKCTLPIRSTSKYVKHMKKRWTMKQSIVFDRPVHDIIFILTVEQLWWIFLMLLFLNVNQRICVTNLSWFLFSIINTNNFHMTSLWHHVSQKCKKHLCNWTTYNLFLILIYFFFFIFKIEYTEIRPKDIAG